MKYFYITTPLYYVNDKPHLGTVYSTVTADVLKRYHRLFGFECFMLTGTDEHGQKCYKSAEEHHLPVQLYCKKMAEQFKNTWAALNISYDLFLRTTFPWHKKAVQTSLQKLYDNKQIYTAVYEGWYSISEEIFYTEKDIIKGKSPTGKEVVKIKEKNYFFKMSAYQQHLIEYIKKNPDFIQPDSRKNEVLGFLKKPLADLCISRPKSRLQWGVELPFDKNYVAYVWVDALLNYASGVGLYQPDHENNFQKWWKTAGAIHLIGKDILITHAVYWPCLLLALNLPLPKKILAHGWLLNRSHDKMSKSQGDVMDPLELLKIHSADSLRYFLVRDIFIGKDAPVSHHLINQRINDDLVNNFGNLLRRCTTMIEKNFNSYPPATDPLAKDPLTQQIQSKAVKTAKNVKKHILDLQAGQAVEHIMLLLDEANKYLEQKAPWKLIKNRKETAGAVLSTVLEIAYLCSILLTPVMPKKMQEVLNSLNVSAKWPEDVTMFFQNNELLKNKKIQILPPLFPRIEKT